MKAIELEGPPTIKCDESGCDWGKELQSLDAILAWYNKPCPKCGKGKIINHADLIAATTLKGLSEMDINPEDASSTPISVLLDTAIFRP